MPSVVPLCDTQKGQLIFRSLAAERGKLVLEECFTVIVAPDPRPWVYAPYVKGFTYDSENAPIVHGVWLDK